MEESRERKIYIYFYIEVNNQLEQVYHMDKKADVIN